jgi:hypothetical protein
MRRDGGAEESHPSTDLGDDFQLGQEPDAAANVGGLAKMNGNVARTNPPVFCNPIDHIQRDDGLSSIIGHVQKVAVDAHSFQTGSSPQFERNPERGV